MTCGPRDPLVVRPRKLCALDRSAVTRYTTIRVLLNHRGAKVFENDRRRDGFAHAAFTRYVIRQPLIERRLDTCFFHTTIARDIGRGSLNKTSFTSVLITAGVRLQTHFLCQGSSTETYREKRGYYENTLSFGDKIVKRASLFFHRFQVQTNTVLRMTNNQILIGRRKRRGQ